MVLNPTKKPPKKRKNPEPGNLGSNIKLQVRLEY